MLFCRVTDFYDKPRRNTTYFLLRGHVVSNQRPLGSKFREFLNPRALNTLNSVPNDGEQTNRKDFSVPLELIRNLLENLVGMATKSRNKVDAAETHFVLDASRLS